MRKLQQSVISFLQSEDGPAPVEYAVMMALVVMVCIGSMNSLGANVGGTFTNVAGKLKVPSGS